MRALPNHEHMTQIFKLEVNIHESNGLTMVINDVLLKVKLYVIINYIHPYKWNAYCTLIIKRVQLFFWSMFQN